MRVSPSDASVAGAAGAPLVECDADPPLAVSTNVAGTVNVLAACPPGTRVVFASSGAVYEPVQEATVYRIVTNAFVANGGDGFAAIKNAAGFRSDTGGVDSDAFRNYLAALGDVSNPVEERITVIP